MSSGIATKTYGVTLVDEHHVEISKSRNNYIQRQKFELLSGFVSELFNHKTSGETMKNVSNLIVLSLNSFKDNLQNRFTSEREINLSFASISECISEYRNEKKQELNDPLLKYGRILNSVHSIIANCPDLTSKQKLEYCNIERYFIKSFFKELALKY